MPGSIGRTERTGPISGGRVEWKTATNRVIPPSTTCSQTMSAALSPVWGRASTEFSIFTARAGRLTASDTSTPVSGQTIGSGSGVGVGLVVVGVVVVVGAGLVAVLSG